MKSNKNKLLCIYGLYICILGLILEIVAIILEFGIWGLISRPSIEETKLLFNNQPILMISGLLLLIIGYIITALVKDK